MPAADSTAANDLLYRIGRAVVGLHGVRLEFSLRMRPAALLEQGRFSVWLPGSGNDRLARLLEEVGAPEVVIEAAGAAGAMNLGLGVAVAAGVAALRLYRHDRRPATLQDRYRAYRWQAAKVERLDYEFHFLPETPAGRNPASFVAPALRPGFASLANEEHARLGSGFWLRRNRDGVVDQADIGLPWSPLIAELPGIERLRQRIGTPAASLARWNGLPVRHVAATGPNHVTLYAAAQVEAGWPADEAALQGMVTANAGRLHAETKRFLAESPKPLPPAEAAQDLGAFYDGSTEVWRRVLGAGLHYHAGLFDRQDADPSDPAMDAALTRAVRDLYPHIPRGSRVYDIGCGWGGPAAMLAAEAGCSTLGLTVSRMQFRHVAALGLPVRLGDAEATLPPGRFDVALLLESLSHVGDKPRLLAQLRRYADRLVMRVNCQDGAPPGPAFGGTMQMVSSADLRGMLTAAGWTVHHWQDRRAEAWPSAFVWRRRLHAEPPGDRHIQTLRTWCERVCADPARWAVNNPLIEVVAT